jgi:hypothetical protein
VDTFLFEPKTDRYLGRLCKFSACPRDKPDCRAPGCGAVPFNKRIPDFRTYADLLAPAQSAMLYERQAGRIRSALDLPTVGRPSNRIRMKAVAAIQRRDGLRWAIGMRKSSISARLAEAEEQFLGFKNENH